MKQYSPKTALMVYAVSPKIQAAKKAVFGSFHYRESLELFEKLHTNTQRIATNSKLETFWIFDDLQEGKSFGERYAKAFDDLFKQGFDQVISIGNDIPGLEISHIQKAKEAFITATAVLGPAEDGGNYLIALSKLQFEAASFADLPWNSDQLHRTLKLLIQSKNGSVSQLEYLIDIDDFQSLSDFKIKTKSGAFFRFINQLLRSISTFSKEVNPFYYSVIRSGDHPLRAPPAFSI